MRLGMVAVFTVFFSLAVVLVAKGKRVEDFAAAAAAAAYVMLIQLAVGKELADER